MNYILHCSYRKGWTERLDKFLRSKFPNVTIIPTCSLEDAILKTNQVRDNLKVAIIDQYDGKLPYDLVLAEILKKWNKNIPIIYTVSNKPIPEEYGRMFFDIFLDFGMEDAMASLIRYINIYLNKS